MNCTDSGLLSGLRFLDRRRTTASRRSKRWLEATFVPAESGRRKLSLDPDYGPDLARLVGVVAQGRMLITKEQALELVDILEQVENSEAVVALARAWGGVLVNNPAPGMRLQPAETLDARLAYLAAVGLAHQDPLPAAEAVLASAPGHPQACAQASRRLVLSKRPADALQRIASCEAAGAFGALDRIAGDALDDIGRFSMAVERYDAAGASTHAAIIRIQEGLPGEIILESGPPDAELHRLWWGLLTGDAVRIRQGQSGVAASGIDGPEFSMALAAVAIWDQQPEAARELLGSLTSTEAKVIRARADLLDGEVAAAQRRLSEAIEERPQNLRLRIAQAVVAGEGLQAVLSTHPVDAALYADQRRRDVPWPAILPTAWLTAGLDDPSAALVHVLLEDAELEAADEPRLARWRDTLDPLWHWGGDLPVTEPAAVVVRLQAVGLSESVPTLRELASRHPNAVGLQELLLRLQVTDANR